MRAEMNEQQVSLTAILARRSCCEAVAEVTSGWCLVYVAMVTSVWLFVFLHFNNSFNAHLVPFKHIHSVIYSKHVYPPLTCPNLPISIFIPHNPFQVILTHAIHVLILVKTQVKPPTNNLNPS